MKCKILIKIARFFKHGTSNRRCHKDVNDVKSVPSTEEFERCVICGKLTCIPISMPVDWRENYEIGLGQICAECAKKEREAKPFGIKLTTEQILQAVEQCRKENK